MSVGSNSVASPAKPGTFELKSAQLPLVSLLLKTTDVAHLAAEWDAQYGATPNFFDQDPLVIDLSHLTHAPQGTDAPDATAVPDFSALVAMLRAHQVCPLAVRGGSPEQHAAALRAGLVVAQDVVLQRVAAPQADAAAQPPAPSASPATSAASSEPAAVAEAAPPPASAPTGLPALVLDKPLRSGQQVYARGRDLVVLCMVNPGAEVIADGHIHVYAPLRGKAIAGARGNADARIFALSLEPELLSIAGVYRTSEVPLPPEVRGKTAMVSLRSGPDGDKLVMDAIRS